MAIFNQIVIFDIWRNFWPICIFFSIVWRLILARSLTLVWYFWTTGFVRMSKTCSMYVRVKRQNQTIFLHVEPTDAFALVKEKLGTVRLYCVFFFCLFLLHSTFTFHLCRRFVFFNFFTWTTLLPGANVEPLLFYLSDDILCEQSLTGRRNPVRWQPL